MGVGTRKHFLPAPTDSAIESNEESAAPTDLGTDISTKTDKTSHTIPEDGRPITVRTGKKRSSGKGSHSHNHSQTSLLIEYFDGGKDPKISSRPSLRVKVRPSKTGEKAEGELVVTEAQGTTKQGTRKQSYRRRKISLGRDEPEQIVTVGSVSSYSSLSDEGRVGTRGVPIEVEVRPGANSDLSGASRAKYTLASDVSSMPADSMLEGNPPATRPERSRSLSREEIAASESVKSPTRRRSRSLSRERLTQKVLEKIAKRAEATEKPSKSHGERSSRERSSRSMSKDALERDIQSRTRLAGKKFDDASVSTGTESLIATRSAVSDRHSAVSGTSKSSLKITDPKVLRTLEDVVRRVVLPQFDEMRKERKVSSTRKKFEALSQSDVSESSASLTERRERRSKHSRTPDAKVRSGKESSSQRRRRRKELESESPSDRSSRRRESGDSQSYDERHRRRSKESRLKTAAAGALVGGALTVAALEHHDSRSSLEKHERRRRHSKGHGSRSRSASISEADEIFEKHGVPPMPMRSEANTDLTRSSILSDSTTTPTQKSFRHVAKGSPNLSPAPRSPASNPTTPNKRTADLRKGLGTYHGNLSNRDLASFQDEHDLEEIPEEVTKASPGFGGAASLAAATLFSEEERHRRYENNLHHQHPIRRGLSPIQSVASYTTSEPARNSMMRANSVESLPTPQAHRQISMDSLSSAQSLDNSKLRPAGISLETGSEILAQHKGLTPEETRDLDADAFFDEQHNQNDRYRESYASSDVKPDYRRLTGFTDDSVATSNIDDVKASQPVARGRGANPEYVEGPPEIESAVASLYEPSIDSTGSTRSSVRSQVDSIERQKRANYQAQNIQVRTSGSPLKREVDREERERSFQQRMGATSPPQSVASSHNDKDIPKMGYSSVPIASDPLPQIMGDLDSPHSSITTNPSIIQGPIGGAVHGTRDHWPYDATPNPSKSVGSPEFGKDGLGIADAAFGMGAMGAGLGVLSSGELSKDEPAGLNLQYDPLSPRYGHDDTYAPGRMTPKDEGYISAANPGTYSPKPKARGLDDYDTQLLGTSDDPFFQPGGNLGQAGKGVENIQSQDIVALMDHLTVRDAQRNARDTEILVTLVRSAAEMRSSFEDMKKYIADQDDLIMDTAELQHKETQQKVINGPRPQPLGTPRTPLRSVSREEDPSTKRKNVFQRAIRGLSTKNTAELQNIEGMLMRLLDEVEGLRADQDPRATSRLQNSINSVDNREPTDPGYEPEGQAGTSSTGDRSGFFSNPSSRHVDARGARRDSTNRVSTVIEGDEETDRLRSVGEAEADRRFSNGSALLSPDPGTPEARDVRGVSAPAATPPRVLTETRAFSNENTPQMSSAKFHRKNKSNSSSFHPRNISRWSKTTASSIVDNLRSSVQGGNKVRPYSQVSHSGENLDAGAYYHDPQHDQLRDTNTYTDEQYDHDQENRPPSPLIPSQVSENPKYQSHRNSQNLQHPRPQQGPTDRFQHHLENEAEHYAGVHEQFSPTSQSSSFWGQHPNAGQQNPNNPQQRYSGYSGNDRLSPISDGGHSQTSSAMMDLGQDEHERNSAGSQILARNDRPRSRHSANNDPLVPQRPPKVPISPANAKAATRQATYVDHVSAARAGSPALDKSPVAALRPSQAGQQRKPSGPRPIIGSGGYSPGQVKRTRFRGSPNQIESDEDLR